MSLMQDGEQVRLEPQVFRLLLLLVENHSRIVTRDEINAKIWEGRHVSDAALTSRLRSARIAVGDNGSEQRLIKTIPNTGLRFVGEVTARKVSIPSGIIQQIRRYGAYAAGALITCALSAAGIWYAVKSSEERALEAEFMLTPDAAISGFNNKRFFYVSRHDCMRLCLKQTDFVCRSFDYYNLENACDLSEETAESIGGLKTDYELPQSYDHYARIMPEE
ncbi:winged helix-turn-helix domain-containing protein [Ponticaulis koreensis]|uniref:winged helix-turn-helix domain-containing protein n=1 Tax=Ponticaulis koreensis TaxID=1123045 RepID=UPI0003B3676B|nr:winged helix-turn-helix domain-containing protein [Ponticaulis koreensis]